MDLATLTQSQRLTFSLRYFPEEPWTRKKIGEIIDVSRQRVGQIETKAKYILRATMNRTTWKDFFAERFFRFGNCSISDKKQDQLQGFIERNYMFIRGCSDDIFINYLYENKRDQPFTSDHFQNIVSSRVTSFCENRHTKDHLKDRFLSDLRNLSLTLSDGSFDDAFGRALQHRMRIEPRSEGRTESIKVSM